MVNRFELENAMMRCWSVVDDIAFLEKATDEERKVLIEGITILYNAKFHEMFSMFETLIQEGKIT
jgi:enoyl reductase-like protein